MRICFICNQIAAWGKIGGFGINTRRIGRALAKQGVDVHVVVPRRYGQGRIEQLDGMRIYGQSLAEVFSGKRLYQEIDADIYHVEEPNICGYWAQKAMPHRIHLVTSMNPRTYRQWWIEFTLASWQRRLRFPIQYFYENGPMVHSAVHGAHGVYVEAEFLKQKARQVYHLKYTPGLLPKPVEVPEGPFKKPEKPLCVFLGRLEPIKRPHLFFQLAERVGEWDFIAAGTASERGYHNYLSRKYFHLPNLEVPGLLTDNALSQILRKAWVLVHPARQEAFPNVFLEASAHEVAILSYVDPDNYVSRFGRVVAAEGGLDALEHGLRHMVYSGEWLEKGKAGRTYTIQNYSISASVARHLKVYSSYLGNPGCE